MRLSRYYFGLGVAVMLLGIIGLLCIPHAQSQVSQKQLSVYTAQSAYSVPVFDRDGKEYVGLSEVLQPLGQVTSSLEGRQWKLRFNEREAQFNVGKARARVNRQDVLLSVPPLTENGRVLMPLRSLPLLLKHILPGRAMDFREQSRRLFLDGVAVRYSTELRKTTPPQLVITFTGPVSPYLANEGDRLRFTFRREAIVSGTAATVRFENASISSLAYSETNGWAELLVEGTVPLTAAFSPDHKTITISAAPRPAAPPAFSPASLSQAQQAGTNAANTFLVIDAAHGGEDHGGAITNKVAEKDVTLTFARQLYRELESLGIGVRLVRDSDATITPEQRAAMTNANATSLFVTIHATAAGNGVRLFTARLKPAPPRLAFLAWDTAQSAYVGTSQVIATAIATELLKHDMPAVALTSSVHPLNNVAAPAVAIEVAAPLNGNMNDLTSPQYAQAICRTIAAAIAANRARLPEGGTGR